MNIPIVPEWLFWLIIGAVVSWAAWSLANFYFELRARGVTHEPNRFSEFDSERLYRATNRRGR